MCVCVCVFSNGFSYGYVSLGELSYLSVYFNYLSNSSVSSKG